MFRAGLHTPGLGKDRRSSGDVGGVGSCIEASVKPCLSESSTLDDGVGSGCCCGLSKYSVVTVARASLSEVLPVLFALDLLLSMNSDKPLII
jgi:hypothetical protein